MWHVYICDKKSQLYTGITTDLDHRMRHRVSINRAMKALKKAGKIIHEDKLLILPALKTA